MQSKAKSVSDYLKEVPHDRKAILTEIRKACLKNLKGYEEVMEYGGPCYKRNGAVEVGFMSQARYISLYILKQEVIKKNKEALKDLNVGKGCIRFPNPRQINMSLVSKLLKDTFQSDDVNCGPRK